MDFRKDEHGLTSSQAARQLAKDGPNLLPSDESRLSDVLLNAIKEPMFLLLIAASCLYFILGDLTESLILLFMVLVTVGITLYQEGKTEKTLHALKDLSSPRALVIRDGVTQRISGKELVAGDIVLLSEGDRVAADAELLSAMNLQVDESLLTGEFFPVSKYAVSDSLNESASASEAFKVKSGTLVVQGIGTARVTATGIRSELGKIGTSLQTLKTEASPLQIEIRRIVKFLAIGGVLLSCIITLTAGFIHHDWLKAVLIGIALAMSLLPEELSVILAVFPAIGAWRLSRAHVLTRRLAAIETLGAISVLCTDKTGTLTENRMTVEYVWPRKMPLVTLAGLSAYPEEIRSIAEVAALASKPQPFDPMEKAFHALATRFAPPIAPARKLIKEYPLTPELSVMSNVWQFDDGSGCLVAAKGAPEAMARLCRFSEKDLAELHIEIDRMAEQGHRTLAVAYAKHDGDALPDTQAEYGFEFMGLVGLNDPLRPEIPAAISQCHEAGIRVIMITGDHPTTAAAIARQAGIAVNNILSGDDIGRLSDEELRSSLKDTNVLARISPFQKLRIVEALKEEGMLVGMTGDGVNDAPALKAAHVGIAMGGKGTDVAREAAPFVLLDDNFASIVHGIRLGRQIFANMQHSMSYILAIHVPIGGMALLPLLLGWPQLLYPLHIVFMELIIDPACALAFENQKASSSIMEKPPRKPDSELLSREVVSQAILQGLIALVVVALTFALALKFLTEGQARAVGFVVLVYTNLALIFSNLHKGYIFPHVFRFQNRVPWAVAAITMVSLVALLNVPIIIDAFNFAALDVYQFALATVIGLGALLLFEFAKAVWRGKLA